MSDTVILFKEDWEYTDAIVHNSTKNTSFLEYANLLKSMGVENHMWPLQLHNAELEFVDPTDPDLTTDQMFMVRQECRDNPFYYFREVARAPGHTKEVPKYLLANRGNMAMYWLFFNAITVYLVQIRQTGKSLSMDHLSEYLCNLYYRSKLVNLLTRSDGLRKQNMERMREINDYLPFYLSGHKKGDINNTEEIHFGQNGNRFKGHIPSNSEKTANDVARGFTAPAYLIDEAAFVRWIEVSLPAMLAGGNDARTQAEADGIFYGTIIATTAGKKDDPDGRFIYNLINEAAVWSETYFDAKDREDLYKVVSAASPKGVPEVHCSFNHRQLGKTDEWLRKSMIAAKSTGEAADRDYGNVWTDGAQMSPLSTEDTKRIRNSEKDAVVEIQRPWPFTMRWQMPSEKIDSYMANNHTIMSFDPSESIGRDDCTVNFRSIKDGSVIGAANINETNTIEIAKWIVHLLIKYPNVTWIPENKLNGSTIIDYVLIELVSAGIDPFKRIFNTVVNDYMEFKERYKTIVTNGNRIPREFVNTYRKCFGFKTSGSGMFSREGLYGSVFMSAVKYTGDKIYDKTTIDQILALVERNGRIDHPSGGKDDSVVAWLLSYWFLTHAKNLAHYGINHREVLSVNTVKTKEDTVDNLYNTMIQNRIRFDIDTLVNQLALEKDNFIAMRMESKLKYLESQLSEEDRNILSADELISQLRVQRGRNMRR